MSEWLLIIVVVTFWLVAAISTILLMMGASDGRALERAEEQLYDRALAARTVTDQAAPGDGSQGGPRHAVRPRR